MTQLTSSLTRTRLWISHGAASISIHHKEKAMTQKASAHEAQKPTPGPLLVPLFADRHFEVDAVGGFETFNSDTAHGILWKSDEVLRSKTHATKKTEVKIFEQARRGTFADIFGWFGRDHRKLCLTQAQVLNFLRKYTMQVANYHSVCFLLHDDTHFHVAYTRFHELHGKKGFVLKIMPMDYTHIWDAFVSLARHSHRIVVIPCDK